MLKGSLVHVNGLMAIGTLFNRVGKNSWENSISTKEENITAKRHYCSFAIEWAISFCSSYGIIVIAKIDSKIYDDLLIESELPEKKEEVAQSIESEAKPKEKTESAKKPKKKKESKKKHEKMQIEASKGCTKITDYFTKNA